VPVAILVVLAFVLIVARETREVVVLAGAMPPVLGQVVLWTLLFIYAVCVAVPVLTFMRLPKRLVPPSAEDVAKHQAYVAELARRLRANRNVSNHDISASDLASVERALHELAQLARQRIIEAATTVFVSTAVSQSGRLDALMVLATQSRLVWEVAHLYWQRPSFADVMSLYANVAAATFVAQNAEDFDFSELVEPVLAPVLANSVVATIPGFGPVAHVVANSSSDSGSRTSSYSSHQWARSTAAPGSGRPTAASS